MTDISGAFVERLPPHDLRPGPLRGCSFAAKDMADTIGRAASCGLALPPELPPQDTADVLAALQRAGAQLVGFTKMTALAFEPSGANPAQGRPLNPHDPTRICGGSSSGSAVAVAAGLVAVAIGSDTAGSLRIPAHCCGVTALKPTFGALSQRGMMALAPSLDAAGFLGCSAAAIAPFFEVVALCEDRASAIDRVRLADDVTSACTAAIRAAMAAAATGFAALGIAAHVAEADALIAACDEPVLTILAGEAGRAHRGRIADGTLDAALRRRLEKGLAIPDVALTDAARRLQALRQDWEMLLDGADALLLPVMRIDTPLVTACEPASPDFSARTLYALSALTRFVNGLGLPAVAFPAGRDGNGMPIGLQLVGRHGSDHALLRLVARLQAHDGLMPFGDRR